MTDTVKTVQALRLAAFLDARQTHLGSNRASCSRYDKEAWDNYAAAAAELRRQRALIEQLQRDADEWYCEYHPKHAMGHDGCTGPGILESARIDMLALQLRISRQETRESNIMRDDLAAALRKEMQRDAGEPQDERAAFEVWVCEDLDPRDAEKDGRGRYVLPNVSAYWKGWQARAALSAASPQPPQASDRGEQPSAYVPLTDEEIEAIYREQWFAQQVVKRDPLKAPPMVFAFARAVLARVGQTDAYPARALAEASTWQPMETAPKGERILMLMKHGVIEGRWDGEVGSGYYWRPMEWYPSHWMPLPAAPSSRSRTEAKKPNEHESESGDTQP